MGVYRFTLALALLIGIDFGCPLLPGAVAFEVEQSVDASRRVSVPPDQAVATSHRATGAERVTLAEPRMLLPKASEGVRPGAETSHGRSSTFLPPESSSSLLEDQSRPSA